MNVKNYRLIFLLFLLLSSPQLIFSVDQVDVFNFIKQLSVLNTKGQVAVLNPKGTISLGGLSITPQKKKKGNQLSFTLFGKQATLIVQEFSPNNHLIGDFILAKPISIAISPWKNIKLKNFKLYLSALRKELIAPISLFSQNDSEFIYALDTNTVAELYYKEIKMNDTFSNFFPQELGNSNLNSVSWVVKDPFTNPVTKNSITFNFASLKPMFSIDLPSVIVTLLGEYTPNKDFQLECLLDSQLVLIPDIITLTNAVFIMQYSAQKRRIPYRIFLSGNSTVHFPGINGPIICKVSGELINKSIEYFKGDILTSIDFIKQIKFKEAHITITPKNQILKIEGILDVLHDLRTVVTMTCKQIAKPGKMPFFAVIIRKNISSKTVKKITQKTKKPTQKVGNSLKKAFSIK